MEQLTHRLSVLCSENQYIGCWRKSRTNHTLSGRIRWRGKTRSEEDKIETTQPYDNALLVTLRIGDHNVKKVMVDGGSAAEVMYPDLYKGLNLKLEDLMPYSSPLMSFDEKLVIPKGIIRLPIQTDPEIMEVNFIVVDTYSPYTAIIGRP